MTTERYDATVRDHIHRDAVVKPTIDGFHVFLPCTGCGLIDAFHMKNKLPPPVVRNKLLDKGWTFNRNRRAACPEHSKPKREERTVETDVKMDKPSGEERAATSDRAKRARRETVLLLDDVFDVERGCYKSGESDESVAKTVGLSPEAVRFIREDMFGVIKRPPELAAVDATLTALEKRHNAMASEVQGMVNAAADELKAMRQRVNALMDKYGGAS